MKTTELTKSQYPSPYHFAPQDYIKKLVNLDERFIDTVVDLKGNAGKPKYQECEVKLSRTRS